MEVVKADLDAIKRYLAPPPEAAHITAAYDVFDDVIEKIHNPNIANAGIPIHYKDYSKLVRFRAGEVSIWAGQNHVGKSEMLNQFILSSLSTSKAFIISPEMPIVDTMRYMTYQATLQRQPSRNEIEKFREFTKNKLYLFDQKNTFKPEMLLAVIRYAVDTFKVNHIVIDSLMKVGIDVSKEHGQIHHFVDQLCVTAKSLGIHIHLVAHSKKPADNSRPSRYDIKGSGSISDLADNIFLLWRHWSKEHEIQAGVSVVREAELRSEPDAKLIVDKQRHGDWVGFIPLWHHQEPRLFMDGVMTQPNKTY